MTGRSRSREAPLIIEKACSFVALVDHPIAEHTSHPSRKTEVALGLGDGLKRLVRVYIGMHPATLERRQVRLVADTRCEPLAGLGITEFPRVALQLPTGHDTVPIDPVLEFGCSLPPVHRRMPRQPCTNEASHGTPEIVVIHPSSPFRRSVPCDPRKPDTAGKAMPPGFHPWWRWDVCTPNHDGRRDEAMTEAPHPLVRRQGAGEPASLSGTSEIANRDQDGHHGGYKGRGRTRGGSLRRRPSPDVSTDARLEVRRPCVHRLVDFLARRDGHRIETVDIAVGDVRPKGAHQVVHGVERVVVEVGYLGWNALLLQR
jgi:hypothetical protein